MNSQATVIKPLISLRFIFAIMIFMHHFPVNGSGLFPQAGTLSVTFFFILSGFVLALNYKDKILCHKISRFSFFIKRLIKVYPLHFACFIAAVFLFGGTIYQAVPNELLIQSWIPFKNYYFSFNPLSWYLSTQVFLYFMFPFLITILNKTGYKKAFILFLLIEIIILISTFFMPEKYFHRFYYIFPLPRLLDFVVGIFLCYVYNIFQNKKLHYSKLKVSLFEILSVTSLIIFIVEVKNVSEVYTYSIYYWIPIAILILVFTIFNNAGGGISYLLTNKYLVSMGNVSFSFFMIHILVIQGLNRLLTHYSVEIQWQLQFILYFVLTSALSILISKYYEKPVSTFINKRIIIK
jgi:peptidoglycan/LPS O-acetylase OafA/YrhL